MSKNNRRIRITVSSQTLWHLEQLQRQCGYTDIGHVVDKLVREKRLQLKRQDSNYDREHYSSRR